MKPIKILEVTGLILVLIGFLLFLSERIFYIEQLKDAYDYDSFLLPVGLVLILITFRRKKKAGK
ncbi:hypothetical protein SAMN04490243_0582 [Robiginitalea myxolifaciens]|uniref:Uncharacterized protein n=1 Tax=Robiginitalea myxolifaciens TaxID=400055 RepID=A0A1I6FT02_9FLAO|nr:hypothetical protein [Robiginitalea myxolifaciens]SFR32937.1 hypothetical protein SAMN04490243_0582 [Robiginitalea myxolifaciens]